MKIGAEIKEFVYITRYDNEGFLCVTLIALDKGVRVFAEGLFKPEYDQMFPSYSLSLSI